MGNRFEIHAFTNNKGTSEYGYTCLWDGNSFFKMLFNLIKIKNSGYGCVKLEWRG